MRPPIAPARACSLLRAYMDRMGLDDSVLREEGGLRLRVDGRYVVDLLPVSGGRLAALSTLADPASWPPAHADDILICLLELSVGLLRDHACSLVIDARRQSLQLQQVLPPQAQVVDVERALAELLNLLPFWTQMCRQKAGFYARSPWPI